MDESYRGNVCIISIRGVEFANVQDDDIDNFDYIIVLRKYSLCNFLLFFFRRRIFINNSVRTMILRYLYIYICACVCAHLLRFRFDSETERKVKGFPFVSFRNDSPEARTVSGESDPS